MKKLFYFWLGLICLSVVGCKKDKNFTSFSSGSDLEGIWVRVDQDDYCEYSYEVQGDKLIYRDHSGYIENNYLICEEAFLWNDPDFIKVTVKFEFDKNEQAIYVSGVKTGVFTRIDKDKAYFKDYSGFLRDCTLQRVLGVKQMEKTEERWDYKGVQIGDLYYNLDSKNRKAAVTIGDNYQNLKTAFIPSSVEYMSITYSVTSIGNFAFEGCSGLTSVTIPNSVTSIGIFAFWECTGLTSVHINDIAAWCNIAFYDNPLCYAKHLYVNNQEVTELTIPNSVTSIGDDAFVGCTGLTSVTIPNSVTSIGGGAFFGCTGLTSVTIGNSVTSIGGGAFRGCSGLTSIIIPNSVTSIGDEAFYECSGLTSIIIPNSVTSIGDKAFYECSGLTSVTIGNSVKSIGDYAFYICTGLNRVTIGNSVTSIGNSAFFGCTGLTSVTIPNSVTSIGIFAFCYCTGLTSITCEAVTPPSCGEDAFSGVNNSIPLYVPAQSVSAYKTANEWNNFTNIQAK